MIPDLRALVVATITTPAEAARQVLALRLPGNAAWVALLAVAAINALVYGLSDVLMPVPEDAVVIFELPPLGYFGLLVPALVMSVYAFLVAGRWLGGQGDLQDMLALVTWLQFVRAIVQAVAFVLQVIFPLASLLLALVALIWGLWITANFIDQGHRLGSPFKAFGVMILAGLGVVLALSLLVTLIVGPFMGVNNV